MEPHRPQDNLTGKVAVVTGAAGTLGSEVARQLAKAGAHVLAVDFDENALRALGADAAADGLDIDTHRADVRIEADVMSYVSAAKELGSGVIDLFFNNAGIEGAVARIENLDLDDFRRVFEVNVVGVALGLKHVLPTMIPGGAIVNTASTAALQGSPGVASYIASKHAVLGLTRTARLEAAAAGIRVNAICPGPIGGRMMQSLDSQREAVLGVAEAPGVGRIYSSPADVAAVVLYLLSDRAVLINGQAIVAETGN